MSKDKRVEVLFEPSEYKILEDVARRDGKPVGAVVREAVAKYVTGPSEAEREAAWERLLTRDTGIDPGSPEDIKAAIVAGMDEYLAKRVHYPDDER